MPLEAYYELRSQLGDAFIRDLMGPGAPDEVIQDAPLSRYIVGILYPQMPQPVEPSQDVDVGDGDEEGTPADAPVAMANVRYPSSMGITFAVDAAATRLIAVRVSAGTYSRLSGDQDGKKQRRRRRGEVAEVAEEWRREPLEFPPVKIDVRTSVPGRRCTLTAGLDLYWRIREPNRNDVVAVTLVIVNTRKAELGARDVDAFFQARIEVAGVDPEAPPFVERPSLGPTVVDEDLQAYRLLYRHARTFGVGHGCSVEWEVDEKESSRAKRVWSAFIPRYELLLADSNPDLDTPYLSMLHLAKADRSEVLSQLDDFCAGYHRWIGGLELTARPLPSDLQAAAQVQLVGCREALSRMRAGVKVLDEDDDTWEAFRLMNRAMLQTRARATWLKSEDRAAGPVEGVEHKWRPFQIGFILLCLEGLARSDSPDRRLADLLWFPTGGGKTEAYLGLIGLTVFLRRLRWKDRGAGITVLMRYTLRLLTLQQFERASLLICSCEFLRRQDPGRLGSEPISIGLWVGQDSTPNTRDETRKVLNQIRGGASPEKRNPMQLRTCPWDGRPLTDRNYYITDNERLTIACRNGTCEFGDGLPVYVVDEDIYDHHPTLIVATVDKFAGLPWRGESATLFNLGRAIRPPELIIQDELHLISGPLGSLVGLYEAAVDLLCSHDGVQPKVIASTATIRRAGPQAAGLFNREVRQFPPSGLDARDSYFALEARAQIRGTRMYVGVMAPGTSQTTLLVRTYASLLQTVGEVGGPPEAKDPYWTLIGYFNSLRVLGGARMQVQDDVNDRIDLLARERGCRPRSIENRIELTSREPSAHIPEHLRRMSVQHPAEETLDVILATNMISVGVDINRLGLMVVMGQPPSTSEYIQSTSRVGRVFPGLVVTLYNAAKSRDRSHYESFVAYHSALYRQVESSSVTPFSSRARDRGFHAVLIALARLLIPDLQDNRAAGRVTQHLPEIGRIRDLILDRVRNIAAEDASGAAAELDEILEIWVRRAGTVPSLVYRNDRQPEVALLVDGSREDTESDAFRTLWSLRDVDQSTRLRLINLRVGGEAS